MPCILRRPLIVLACIGLTLPLLAQPDDTDQARKKTQEQAALFRRRMQMFQSLPMERREQIVQLDQDLHKEAPSSRDHLLAVAERYRDWLERLDDKDRQKIKEAPDKAARLALIKSMREYEWVRFQPKAFRDRLATLEGQERADFLKKLRHEDQLRHQDWVIAASFWNDLTNNKNFLPPVRLADLSRDIQDYITEYLKPMLSREEKDRLAKAEGNWPAFPLTLVELSDKHPPALQAPEGPMTFADLPIEVQKRFLKPKGSPIKALKLPGHAFAIYISDLAASKNIVLPNELWPTQEPALSPAMKKFCEKLGTLLSNDENRRLNNARGKWPEFPQTIQELARNHKLQPPWFTLPGPRERWDSYRTSRITLPDSTEKPR